MSNEVINDIPIKKTYRQLPKWKGEPDIDTYNNKPILDWKGKPVFAEIYALNEFKELGYEGVWVDTFRRKYWIDIPERSEAISLPQKYEDILFDIRGGNIFAGTWDLFLWKEEEIRFVELKRQGKDKIRDTQIDFLRKALEKGYYQEAFELYEWIETNPVSVITSPKECQKAISISFNRIVSECRQVLGSELHYQAMIYHILRDIGKVPLNQIGMNVKIAIQKPTTQFLKEGIKTKHKDFQGYGKEIIPDISILNRG